jgi:hypothetical protein
LPAIEAGEQLIWQSWPRVFEGHGLCRILAHATAMMMKTSAPPLPGAAHHGGVMTLGAWRLGLLLASAVAAAGCSSSTAPRLDLHVDVSDATGDAPTSGSVPNPPDLVRVTVDVSRGIVTFEIRFAAGWDQPTTFTTIDLDIDQDSATGVPSGDLGIEYEVSPNGIVRFDGMTTTMVGTPGVSPAPNGLNLTAPLSVFGNDDGRMNFRARAQHVLQPAFDFVPDESQPPARVE